ncbi:hypothetical protein MAQ5080_02134 [Marinomonas aquimarina]|uniref:Uncharacterized protein n=1 Tax=Marinomonas aquimarina TaxID=295068 RepID=A0A1A8TIM0_9GAMM|nr:hypothetical protein [Marinomonas aquimarina]SBS32003.1 hypothetical protein MAQ5080_02134 [Marinomonas aquimarina]
MVRTLLITLLIPLIACFSISVKAVDSNESKLVKHGSLECVYELPSAEVAPDIDHTMLPSVHNEPIEANHSKLIAYEGLHASKIFLSWCCRGPPQA